MSGGLFGGGKKRSPALDIEKQLKRSVNYSASYEFEDEDQCGLPEMGFTSTKVNKESQPFLLVLSHWRLCIALHHYV